MIKIIGIGLFAICSVFEVGKLIYSKSRKLRNRRARIRRKKLYEAYERRFDISQREIEDWRQGLKAPKKLHVICKDPKYLPAWE